MSRDDLIRVMSTTMQTTDQSVLDHGRSVVLHHQQLMDHLRHGASLPEWWRLPAWIKRPGLLEQLPGDDIMREYHEFHDCGKPFCRTLDDQGRAHYPDHAAWSERVWREMGGHPLAAYLMGRDMDAHLLKGENIAEFARKPWAAALLLTALSEIHSNALIFGGINSDSFKIKAKNLDKRGGQAWALIAQTK